MGQGTHEDPRQKLAKRGQFMTTATVSPWQVSEVEISSPEVDHGEKWDGKVVVKGKVSTDNLLGYKVLFYYSFTA